MGRSRFLTDESRKISVSDLPPTPYISFIEMFSKNHQPFDEIKATNGGTTFDHNLIYRLLRTEEKNYLMVYWLDYFHNLRKTERVSMLDGILDNHS